MAAHVHANACTHAITCSAAFHGLWLHAGSRTAEEASVHDGRPFNLAQQAEMHVVEAVEQASPHSR